MIKRLSITIWIILLSIFLPFPSKAQAEHLIFNAQPSKEYFESGEPITIMIEAGLSTQRPLGNITFMIIFPPGLIDDTWEVIPFTLDVQNKGIALNITSIRFMPIERKPYGVTVSAETDYYSETRFVQVNVGKKFEPESVTPRKVELVLAPTNYFGREGDFNIDVDLSDPNNNLMNINAQLSNSQSVAQKGVYLYFPLEVDFRSFELLAFSPPSDFTLNIPLQIEDNQIDSILQVESSISASVRSAVVIMLASPSYISLEDQIAAVKKDGVAEGISILGEYIEVKFSTPLGNRQETSINLKALDFSSVTHKMSFFPFDDIIMNTSFLTDLEMTAILK